jgi:hypothetical protein
MVNVLSCSWCGCVLFTPISKKLVECQGCRTLKTTDDVHMTTEDPYDISNE